MNTHSAFQPRFGSPVVLTALGGPSVPMPAVLLSADGRFLTVRASGPLPSGTPVRLDVDGGLVLGEIVGSACAEGVYYLTAQIDQAIPSLSDLAALVRTVMELRGGDEDPTGERRAVRQSAG